MRAMRRPWLPLLLVACLTACARGELQTQVQRIINAAGLQQTRVGLYVQDLRSGEVLASIDPDNQMMPASNLKLVTTAAAVKLLGPDFAFRTSLNLIEPQDWPAGTAPPGAAKGAAIGRNLVVRGDGDPGFADPDILTARGTDVEAFLQSWVAAAKAANLTAVDQIIIDDRVFDRIYVHPTWPEEQLNRWYCAQVSGLTFYDNCLDVYTDPTGLGQNPRVRLVPAAPFLSTTNRAVTGKVDTFWVARKAQNNELTFRGEVKTHRVQPVNVTIDDPPNFFGQLLAYRLAEAGIKVNSISRPGPDDRLPTGRELIRVETPLALVLQRCNKDSQNLFAESLFKRMGRSVTGMPGSWENGSAAVRGYLHELLGTQAADLSIVDGSGMSRDNRVTARALVGILAAMNRDPKLGPIYRASLSVGGSDGTLQKRFRQNIAGQVFGKSGYIGGVSSLSGYLVLPEAGGGEHVIAFSFLFNGFKPPVYPPQIKSVQDQIVRLIDQHTSGPQAPIGQGG
ncbi:MAG: D-alanyl-D-alanine carboxypeptidase/D-alanyl-D-alanine-endopeptidase [Planctomycetota bacterium]|nr:D-alanyl-D-alanine carboxypeptidase/D-alanyl-D-alanine-endopeptidase [Planctomycetota bacterium]